MIRDLLGRVVLQPGDVLLIQAPIDTIRGLQNRNDLVLLDELEKDLPTTSRKGIAIGICIAVILLPMLQVLDLMASVLFGVVLMVVTGCLRPGELQRAIRWDVILLLGSIVCFSVAMQNTGLARGLAVDLLQSLQGWPNYLVLMVVFLLAQLFTETLTNGATVVLLIPIATAGQRFGPAADGLHLRHFVCGQPQFPDPDWLPVQLDGDGPWALSLL